MDKKNKIKNNNCPHPCPLCNKSCLFYKNTRKNAKKQGFKLAVGALFLLGLVFMTCNSVFAQSVDYTFETGDFIGDSYPEYIKSINIGAGEYFLVFVYLQDPYIDSYFDYVKLQFGSEEVTLSKLSDDNARMGFFYYDNRDTNYSGVGYLKAELSGDDTFLTHIDLFSILGVDSLEEVDLDSNSSTSTTHSLSLGSYAYPWVFIFGGSEVVDYNGTEVHNWAGTHSYSSSTMSSNPQFLTEYAVAVTHSELAVVFESQYQMSYNPYTFTRSPSFDFSNPKLCTYGQDCIWDFFYSAIVDEEATATLEMIALETGTVVGTSSVWLNIPFTNTQFTISSTTGFTIGDQDAYYMTLEQGSDVLWSASGTIQWTGTTTFWQNELLPDCTTAEICSYLSSSTSFWSAENFGCGLNIGLCYAFKPSGASVNAFLSGLSEMQNNFPFNTVFGLIDDVSSWDTVQVSSSSAVVWIYKDETNYWLDDFQIITASNMIYGDGQLFSASEWGNHEDTIYNGDTSVMAWLSLILDLGLAWIIFVMVLRRINKHKELDNQEYQKI